MPSPSRTSPPHALALVVSDFGDEVISQTRAALEEAGARVEIVAGLFQAVVRMSGDADRAIRMVLIDERCGDRIEPHFFRVVQVYYPWIVAACLSSTAPLTPQDGRSRSALTPPQAAARLRRMFEGSPLPAPPVTECAAVIEPTRPMIVETPPRAAAAPEAAPVAAPSTESLHESVRQRMAADAGVPLVRRVPPRTPPPAIAPEPAALDDELKPKRAPAAAAGSSAVTSAELDALLRTARGDSNGDRHA